MMFSLHQENLLTWNDGQAFSHFRNWECFNSGYWTRPKCNHQNDEESADILNSSRFMNSMRTLILCWPITTAIHLTNTQINRRSWLGQVTCYFDILNCADCTVKAWAGMTHAEQKAANLVADEMVRQWNYANFDRANYQRQNGQLE